MAAKTLYLTNDSTGPGSDLSETDPGAEAFRSPVTGWVLGNSAADGNHSAYFNDVERATGTFVDTTPPAAPLDSVNGDFWVSPEYTGTFAAGDWVQHVWLRQNTAGGANSGSAIGRVYKGKALDGSDATEITSAQQVGTLSGTLVAGAPAESVITFSLGEIILSGERLFFQLAWRRETAGVGATQDGNLRIGNAGGKGSLILTPDFTESAPEPEPEPAAPLAPDVYFDVQLVAARKRKRKRLNECFLLLG